jgi:hypothetical protein
MPCPRRQEPAISADPTTIAIAVLTLILLWRFKKLPEPYIVAAGAGSRAGRSRS